MKHSINMTYHINTFSAKTSSENIQLQESEVGQENSFQREE